MKENWKNKLFFGDNLDIMQEHIPDEYIDLIYLDPPFNSNATYNVLFEEKNGTQSGAQIAVFEDTWQWGYESEDSYQELVTKSDKKLADLISALRKFLGQNNMMAYITMMAIRLVEMNRVLKPTGSIYLHCDPTASHYLKLVLDAIFGIKNFRNEIIWHYRTGNIAKKQFQRKHDVILFYSKSETNTFTPQEIKEYYVQLYGPQFKPSFKGRKHGTDKYGEYRISFVDDVWNDISAVFTLSKEHLEYPTQKPIKLLERIIKASSNEGDIIMDPFCGCGTTIVVSESLNRRWIGIDITHLAITLMKHRLEHTFDTELSSYEVIGDPKDINGAKALAKHDPYQFEWWALGRIAARPARDKQKGADSGVDGYIYFFDDESGTPKKIIIQVKSGHVTRSQIATLKGDMEREDAAIGAFITLENPTRPMIKEAASAGFYEPKFFKDKHYPKLQILTIEELLNDKEIDYPKLAPQSTYKKVQRKSKKKSEQVKWDF